MSTDNSDQHSRLLFVLLIFNCALWFLLPTLFQPNANLDVVEGFIWGKEFQLGYDKHPLLAPWLTYLVTQLSPASEWPVFLLSQVSIGICLFAAWRLAKCFLDSQTAIFSVLLLTTIPYYNYITPEFNPNILELPLWALLGLFGYRAYTTEKLMAWVFFGCLAGLSIITKYYSAVLLLPIGLFFLTPYARNVWKRPGVYLALISAVIIILPNMLWLVNHDFISLTYGASRGSSEVGLAGHIKHPLQFVGTQAAALIPFILVLYFTIDRKAHSASPHHLNEGQRLYLSILTWGPLTVTLISSLVTGLQLQSMWGVLLFTFLPLWLLVFVFPKQPKLRMGRLKTWWFGITIFFALAYTLPLAIGPYFDKIKRRQLYPGPAIGEKITTEWRRKFNTPLAYVIGSVWVAGNAAYYSPDSPSAYIDSNPLKSGWIDEETIKQTGGVILWTADFYSTPTAEELLKPFPEAIRQNPFTEPWQTTMTQGGVTIEWAIIPPQSALLR